MGEAAPLAIWAVDKPAGPTSHDVVAAVRRNLPRGVKVGHAGTLDPFATGLLLVLVGRATRLARYLSSLDKTYRARVRLGWVSSSGDPDGELSATGAHVPDEDELRSAAAALEGRRPQRVPELSAVKVGGVALHRRVRRGERVEPPEREVEVHSLTIERGPDAEGAVDLEVRCGKGTYVRTLASELGEGLGCGAYCETLRRTAVGGVDLAAAVPPEAVGAVGGLPLRLALGHLGQRELDLDEAGDVAHGRPVTGAGEGPVGLWRGERLLAVARPDGDGLLRPEVVLA